jgi:hypothetical protein
VLAHLRGWLGRRRRRRHRAGGGGWQAAGAVVWVAARARCPPACAAFRFRPAPLTPPLIARALSLRAPWP